jgi:hypothetical protein
MHVVWLGYCRILTVNGRKFPENNGNASFLSGYPLFALGKLSYIPQILSRAPGRIEVATLG